MSEPLSEAAPAKLNLYLHVVGRRADGYHELDSLVAFTETGDTLRGEPAADLSLTIEGPFAEGLSTGADNLVLKAARALAASPTSPARDARSLSAPGGGEGGGEVAASNNRGARLTLTKNLPVASGIGGGSSDAAAALRLLRQLWRLETSDAGLHDIAATLGADVPVCLRGTTGFMGGIGDALSAAPALPSTGVVLVNPGIPLATARVFAARRGLFSEPARFAHVPADARELAALLASRRNDLEAPASALVPEITTVLDSLRASPGCRLARLSGSGATCFGLYDSAADAAAAAEWIAARERGWWVAPTRLTHT